RGRHLQEGAVGDENDFTLARWGGAEVVFDPASDRTPVEMLTRMRGIDRVGRTERQKLLVDRGVDQVSAGQDKEHLLAPLGSLVRAKGRVGPSVAGRRRKIRSR